MQEWIKNISLKIEEIALSFEGIEKYYLSKHITFSFENQAIFYLKKDDKKITLGCNKGYLLEDMFDFDYKSKYMRHMYITSLNDFSEETIKKYIQEAIVCSIELNEKKKLKQYMRRSK